jgi:uncharacterized protein (UPF0212 family)
MNTMMGNGQCPHCNMPVTLPVHSPELFEDGTTHWIVAIGSDHCAHCGGHIETFIEHPKITGGIMAIPRREKVTA